MGFGGVQQGGFSGGGLAPGTMALKVKFDDEREFIGGNSERSAC
jgi:hypothetical protein